MEWHIVQDAVQALSQFGSKEWLLLGTAVVVSYFVITATRDVFFHPLSCFPGSTTWIASRLPYARSMRRGNFIRDLKRMHDYHGPIVRYSDTQLSFTSPQAWQDIYGHHGGEKNFPRHPKWYQLAPNGVHSIMSADNATHTRIRRLLAHAFSDKALREQEPLIQVYVDLFVDRLTTKAASRTPVNIRDYFMFTTFDVASDLEFGKPLGCLQREHYHYWIAVMLSHFKRLVHLTSILMVAPFLRPIVGVLIPKNVREQRKKRFDFTVESVGRRLEVGDDPKRSDFMTFVCRHNEDKKGMTRPEIDVCLDHARRFLLSWSEVNPLRLLLLRKTP